MNFLTIPFHSTFGSCCGVVLDHVAFSEQTKRHAPNALCEGGLSCMGPD